MSAYDDIQAERDRQDQQWGGADHDDLHRIRDWSSMVTKQMDRFNEAAVIVPTSDFTWEQRALLLRERMVKAAALSVACIDAIDRRLVGIMPEHTGQPVQPNLCDDPDCPRCGIPKYD
jgi:hypothetical protein